MKKFYCNGKATVYVTFTDKPIRVDVFNDKGKVYYFRELAGKFKNIKFNICHKGHYTISEECEKIEVGEIVIDEVKAELPPPDRSGFKFKKIIKNPDLLTTPARTFRKTGIIETGKMFYNYIFPIRVFILCHELGHLFYKSEENADLFACKLFINKGYNESTALYSLTKVLKSSGANAERVKKLFKNIQL